MVPVVNTATPFSFIVTPRDQLTVEVYTSSKPGMRTLYGIFTTRRTRTEEYAVRAVEVIPDRLATV